MSAVTRVNNKGESHGAFSHIFSKITSCSSVQHLGCPRLLTAYFLNTAAGSDTIIHNSTRIYKTKHKLKTNIFKTQDLDYKQDNKV